MAVNILRPGQVKPLSELQRDIIAAESPSERFTNWYGFDTENDKEGKVTLEALVHESGTRWIWKGAGNFIKWCEAQKDRPMVICHNLEYDLVNEFGKLYPYMQLNYLKGRLISARYHRVTFWDSFNHFRMTLYEIGNHLGIKKLPMDIHSEEYVAQDAWICLKAMTGARDFIASLGGRIGATSGSSAISVWRHITEDEFLLGPLDGPWLRQAYKGGRTEIFTKFTDKMVRGYDINSMYPFCMLKDFPEYEVRDPGLEKSKGVAEVTISVPHDMKVAPLVTRDVGGRLLYPVGVFDGVWTYDEIRFAESLGCKVIRVKKAFGCNALVRPFDEFVHLLYSRRKASKSSAEKLFLKVLMNALYGKIATKNTITRTVSRYSLMKNGSKRMEQVKWIDYHRGLLDYQTPPQKFVNLVWGSMITAHARILLTKYLLKVPPEKLMYCDTDSIYCIDHKFDESTEIGGLKLEKEEKGMYVPQPKVYQHGEFWRAKGVPLPRNQETGELDFKYAREYVEEGQTIFMAPIRFRASLGSRRGGANQWVETRKGRKSEYKSKIYSNGRYFPPVLGEQQEMFPVNELKRKRKLTTKDTTYGKETIRKAGSVSANPSGK